MVVIDVQIIKPRGIKAHVWNFLMHYAPTFYEQFIVYNQTKRSDRAVGPLVRNFFSIYLEMKRPPLFNLVEIETVNWCDNDCPFCCKNVRINKDSRVKMSSELYHSIIDQLASLNFSGRVYLYSNGEPLCDDGIVERALYARKKLPLAALYIYTNGNKLTVDKFKQLFAIFDSITIDNYNDALQMNHRIKEVSDFIRDNPEYDSDRVHLVIQPKNIMRSSRGGTSPNRHTNYVLQTPCTMLFRQFVIRSDGKVALCCNDARGEMIMGDLTHESILNVWYGSKYQGVRRAMYAGRENIEICSKCDSLYI